MLSLQDSREQCAFYPADIQPLPEAQTPLKETPEPLQKADFTNQVDSEAHDNVTVPSDYNTVQPSQYVNNYECDTDHAQYEEKECNSDDDDDCDIFEEEEEATRIDIFNTDNSYSIIYADPSWEGYQSTEELLKLPVGRVADENCALFIWVNATRLHEAQKVIEEWGFSRETIAFVWVKTTEDDNGKQTYYFGQTGNLTRENAEFCLFATKGTIQRVNDNIPQAVLCPIEKAKPNYVKPVLFKKLTVQLLGDLPTLELLPDLEALEQLAWDRLVEARG